MILSLKSGSKREEGQEQGQGMTEDEQNECEEKKTEEMKGEKKGQDESG
jgi:hypothetical protein